MSNEESNITSPIPKRFRLLSKLALVGLLFGLFYWFIRNTLGSYSGRHTRQELPLGAVTGAVRHDCYDPLYRDPIGPVPRASYFVVRLRAAAGELTEAQVIYYSMGSQRETLLPMNLTNGNAQYDWWEATLFSGNVESLLYYAFRCLWKGGEFFYVYQDKPFGVGVARTDFGPWENRWSLAVYSPEFKTPDWVKNAVAFYHVFPDRFRNGDLDNDPTNETTFCYGRPIFKHEEWNELPYDPSIPNSPYQYAYENQYYGGDLQGVFNKLDYLIDLGVDVIYFMPIFSSPSCHGYDTSSWEQVEKRLGSNELFEKLVQAAHSKGMHVLLDGVFGTSSSDSKYFDRFRRYFPPNKGACAFEDSPYHSWYQFIPSNSGPCYDHSWYESWWSVYENLPALVTYRREVQDFFYRANDSIAKRWCRISDGFRLDSPQQISHDYWSGFRTAVKQVKSDAFIVGEAWHWTGDYINHGWEWDSTTNYQLMTYLLCFWRDNQYLDNDHIWGQNDPVSPMSPSQFIYTIQQLSNWYAPEAWYSMLNMLSSHDTSRALFVLDHNAQKNDPTIFTKDYDWSDALGRLRGAFSLLMSLAGVPMIYYGDEVGLVGPQNLGITHLWEDDPFSRLSYPWLDASGTPWAKHLRTEEGQNYIRNHVRLLLKVRKEYKALRVGNMQPLVTDDDRGILVLLRGDPNTEDIALVAMNRGREGWKKRQQIRINIRSINLPEGLAFYDVMGQANDEKELIANPQDGYLRFNLEPWETAILVPKDKDTWKEALRRKPPKLTGLRLNFEPPNRNKPNMTVSLEWDPVAPNSDGSERSVSYLISRSLLPFQGYEIVGETLNTMFMDVIDAFIAGEETHPVIIPGGFGDTSTSENTNNNNLEKRNTSSINNHNPSNNGYPGILFPRANSYARIRLQTEPNLMTEINDNNKKHHENHRYSFMTWQRLRRDGTTKPTNSLGSERTIYYMVAAVDTQTKLVGDQVDEPLYVRVPMTGKESSLNGTNTNRSFVLLMTLLILSSILLIAAAWSFHQFRSRFTLSSSSEERMPLTC
eukprot:jgi/Galph1/576/GphlegSOOS_G5352.1